MSMSNSFAPSKKQSGAGFAFSVGIGTSMLDHLDASPLDAYIRNIQNCVVIRVCKGISIRQQSQSLLTNYPKT